MKKLKSKILIGALAGVALVGVSTAAFAGTSYSSYDVVAPIWQNPVVSGSQTKAVNGQYGDVNVATVGSTYTTDVQMCRLTTCGTKVYGANDGEHYYLGNSFGAGDTVRAQFQINSWNAVSVEITGSWRSN